MASSSAPVANAAVAYSTFETLRLGRTGQSVVGRLIRFWDSRNINKNGEFMGITILLLDELVRIVSNLFPWSPFKKKKLRIHLSVSMKTNK